MPRDEPVLELLSALPFFEESSLPNAALDLRLMPGDCALIETHDPERAAAFADLCSGIIGLRQGAVRFAGFDWTELRPDEAFALRGRIGRIHQKGAWPEMLRTHVAIMLGPLHHTREPEQSIVRSAVELARALGLPGLPLVRPDRLNEGDLIRAACVRAFMGRPRLLLLESAISVNHAELTAPLLDLLSHALNRGAAAICFTRDVPFWQAQSFPLTHRLHLLEDGLTPMRSA
jgi:phospholipid/cholesterol/gamma-HCH transport system ATP-binding protein